MQPQAKERDLGRHSLIVHFVFFVSNNYFTMAATDQIRQMVNFILQEAHEKANEIRVKVCLFF